MNPFQHFLQPLRHGLGGHGHHHHGHHHHHGRHHHGPHHLGRRGHLGHDHGDGRGLPGGPGAGLGGFERGRKLGANDLQLLILALLAGEPSHGYELIKAFGQRSGGYYVPSPGMIYPALSYLEEVGYASVEVAGTKKRYAVTVAGLAHLDEHRAAVDAMWAQLARFGERMARLREDEAGDGGHGRHGQADELRAALETLRTTLRDRHGAPADERRRIAAILARATAAILEARSPRDDGGAA